MKPTSDGVLFTEHRSEAAAPVAFPPGEVVVFSAIGPDKECNEDSAAVLPYPEGGLLVVADGMGGQAGGERASRMTLEALRDRMRLGVKEEEPLRHVVLDAVEAANKSVLDLGIGAGTTLAAVVLRDGRARSVHVGDSLVLHVGQRGRVKARTIAHSPIGYAVAAGVLDEEAAMYHEERHLISNFVGKDGMRIEIGASVPIAQHDTLLIASDGLADNVSQDEIVALIRKGPLLEAGARLAALARSRMLEPKPGAPSKPDDLTFLLYRRN